MQLDILTLFPGMFASPFDFSIIKRAVEKDLVSIKIHDLRNWATDNYKSVDDRPYGGGAGMILRVDIVDKAVSDLKSKFLNHKSKVVLLDATGKRFTQILAGNLSRVQHLIIICGHYEGVDHRVHEHIADAVISIGDYVLSGGEIPAMVLVDSIVRLLPGAVGNPQSLTEESFSNDQTSKLKNEKIVTEYPQYTRPEEYQGWKVPHVLLSGNHSEIEKWRKQMLK